MVVAIVEGLYVGGGNCKDSTERQGTVVDEFSLIKVLLRCHVMWVEVLLVFTMVRIHGRRVGKIVCIRVAAERDVWRGSHACEGMD